jgi:hypothetical protein
MMRVGIAAAVVALALECTGAALAQAQAPQERINTVLARARQVGIPVALLESKIAEGKAKGVSLERIAAAIERRETALERANEALRNEPDAASSLAVAADAIDSGVSQAVLREVAGNAPRDRRNVAIAVLTELVKQGHAPEAALGRVRDAVRRGPDALSNLPAEAGGRGRGGGPPDGQGQGSGTGRAGGDSGSGPPAGVPAPGKPPQAGRPDDAGAGRGRPDDAGAGRGRPDDAGAGRGRPTPPGRGGR